MRVWYVFRFSSIIRNQSFSKIFITSGFTPNSTGPRRLQLDQEVPDVLLKLPRLTGFVETSGVTKKGGKKWRMILKSYPVMWGSTINKHYIRDETHYDIRIPPALWIKHYWNNQQILESFLPGPFFGFFFSGNTVENIDLAPAMSQLSVMFCGRFWTSLLLWNRSKGRAHVSSDVNPPVLAKQKWSPKKKHGFWAASWLSSCSPRLWGVW